jgi:biopolymer transport protein TolQ
MFSFLQLAAAPEIVSATGSSGAEVGVWHLISAAGLVVQFVLALLVVFSLVSWGLIFSKYLSIRDARRQNKTFAQTFWNAPSLAQALKGVESLSSSPLAAVFRLGYEEVSRVTRLLGVGQASPAAFPSLVDNVRRALSQGRAEETTRLGRTVTFLATCANTAPFIGLFGTVWGIMDAFSAIGASGAANLATVAPGIAEALVTTATGLFAAIPAVVFYNYFNRRLQVLEAEMETFSQKFLNLMELSFVLTGAADTDSVSPARQGLGG